MENLTREQWQELVEDGKACFEAYLPHVSQIGERVVAECEGGDWEAIEDWSEEHGVDPHEAAKAFIAGMADAVANHYGVE